LEGFGELIPPQDLLFLAHYGGKAAVVGQKVIDVEG
jgi:hypothetical protein